MIKITLTYQKRWINCQLDVKQKYKHFETGEVLNIDRPFAVLYKLFKRF